MGAACCAGSALTGGGAASGASSDSLLALPLAMYEIAPRATLLVSTAVALLLGLGYLLLLLLTPESTTSSKSELTYTSPSNRDAPLPLPSIKEPASVQLSIVIPAYNERQRLPGMLKDSLAWLEETRTAKKSLVSPSLSSQNGVAGNGCLHADPKGEEGSVCEEKRALCDPLTSYEIIIVDDGSTDETLQVALDTAGELRLDSGAEVRAVRLERNRGKGGAVRHGVLHARGSLVLFADADGATSFADLTQLCTEMARIVTPAGHGIVVGSRAHMVKSDAVVKRSFLRNLLMHLFHLFLTLLLHPPVPRLPSMLQVGRIKGSTTRRLARQPAIKDTQCGFKLFTRSTSALLFPLCHINRWIFDVELLVLAELACRSTFDSIWTKRTRRGGGDGEENPCNEEECPEDLLDLACPVAEVAVHWQETGGSKIDLVKDSIGMALDLLVIRVNYALDRWKAPVVR